jgi:hypothetical protein
MDRSIGDLQPNLWVLSVSNLRPGSSAQLSHRYPDPQIMAYRLTVQPVGFIENHRFPTGTGQSGSAGQVYPQVL